ncbi:MAG: tetraacyldisaccharide 4'-kinase [Nitrospirae bacterium]|nr:tetraacyldisaccharide 4'-kinase [Nitrospirota bacterium]MCL5285897.1 tetraacyldisaccharide 4'-kinase [Nitrospirota bacterium]
MRPLGPAGLPLSLLYGLGTELFRLGYESGVLERKSFGLPVLSVGNIETGGTGKTPLVLSLCRFLLARGRRPGIVSRGYGRRHSGRDLFVCRGQGPLVSPEESGDEPALYAWRYPEVPVVVAKDRRRGVGMLEGLCEIVLLDDGFQSLEIRPSASLVFLPAFLSDRPPRWSDLLPSGLLREPAGSLSRATHWVMVSTGDPDQDRMRGARVMDNLSGVLPPDGLRPLLFQRFLLSEVCDMEGRRLLLPGELSGRRVAVVAGIANPGRVEEGLRSLGAEVVGSLFLPDHVSYTLPILDRIEDFARKMKVRGATLLLTTEKDRVKWNASPTETLPIGILGGEAELQDGERWEALLAALLQE